AGWGRVLLRGGLRGPAILGPMPPILVSLSGRVVADRWVGRVSGVDPTSGSGSVMTAAAVVLVVRARASPAVTAGTGSSWGSSVSTGAAAPTGSRVSAGSRFSAGSR